MSRGNLHGKESDEDGSCAGLERITAEVAARHGMLVSRMILRCFW